MCFVNVISYKYIECKKHLLSPQFIIMLLRKKNHVIKTAYKSLCNVTVHSSAFE